MKRGISVNPKVATSAKRIKTSINHLDPVAKKNKIEAGTTIKKTSHINCLLCKKAYENFADFSTHAIEVHLAVIQMGEFLVDVLMSEMDFIKCVDSSMIQNCDCQSYLKLCNTMGYDSNEEKLKNSFCQKMQINHEDCSFHSIGYTKNVQNDHDFCNKSGEPFHVISTKKKYIALILKTDHLDTCQHKYVLTGILINSFTSEQSSAKLNQFIMDHPYKSVNKNSARIQSDNLIKISAEQYNSSVEKDRLFIGNEDVLRKKYNYFMSVCSNEEEFIKPCFNRMKSRSIPIGCNSADGRCIFRTKMKKNELTFIQRKLFRGMEKFEDKAQEMEWVSMISKLSHQLSDLYQRVFPEAYLIQCLSTSKSCATAYDPYLGRSAFSGISVNINCIKHWLVDM